jgi:hypothetical protein
MELNLSLMLATTVRHVLSVFWPLSAERAVGLVQSASARPGLYGWYESLQGLSYSASVIGALPVQQRTIALLPSMLRTLDPELLYMFRTLDPELLYMLRTFDPELLSMLRTHDPEAKSEILACSSL